MIGLLHHMHPCSSQPQRPPTTITGGCRRAPRYHRAPPGRETMGIGRRAHRQPKRQPQPQVGRRRRALSGLATAAAALGLALLARTAGGSSFPPPPPMGGGMPPSPPPPPPPPPSQGPRPSSSAPAAPPRAGDGGYPQQQPPPQKPQDPMAGAFGGPSSWQSEGPPSGTHALLGAC